MSERTSERVRERVVSFAGGGRLTGVLTEPVKPRPGAPVVISANVGLIHHVGPYRFYVDLGRALARRGFPSLRFDLSGLGNSAVRTDTVPEPERAQADVQDAMAFLARHGHARFVLMGFCSGVDAAHRVAVRDPRVCGACFIEGYAYRTPGFFLHYPLRYLHTARWRRVVSRRIPPAMRELPLLRRLGRYSTIFAEEDEVFVRDYPTPEELRRDYDTMAARGTRQLFVFVGGDSSFNHERQFLEFTGLSELGPTRRVMYLPEADHTFFRRDDRVLVVDRLVDWLDRELGSSAEVEAIPAR